MAGDKQASVVRPAGTIIVSSPDGLDFQADTLRCVHCQAHWRVMRGSGRKRGYCGRCSGPTCSPECTNKCVPFEQRLENIEAGRPEDFVPIVASVPRSIV